MFTNIREQALKKMYDFESGFYLLSNGDCADAYLIFSSIANEEDVAANFNLALCLYKAGEYNKAFNVLTLALNIIKRNLGSNAPNDDLYKKLLPFSQSRYLAPMPQKIPQLLPWLAKENIIRLMIDVAVKTELWDKVIQLSVGLQDFENVKTAIDLVNKNKNN